MKLSFATLGCPTWTLDQIAANAAAMGFDGVELRGVAGEHIGPDEPSAVREQIRTLFRKQKVDIACISAYNQFTSTEPKIRAEGRAQLENMIGVARDVGCPLIRVFGGHWVGSDREANIRCVVESLTPVVEAAEKNGVQLALENHDAWDCGADIAAVMGEIRSPALGVCWDVVNSFFTEPYETTFEAIRDRIIHVHFKDAARSGDRIHSILPGTGQVDLRAALHLLQRKGYTGYLSFEWEKKWEPELEDPEIAFPHYVKFTAGLMRELGVSRGSK
jgi:sugar phosphate isomerase/epimerase